MARKKKAAPPPDDRRDLRLGLNRRITRRDFVYGLPAVAGLLAACRVERGPGGRPGSRALGGAAPQGIPPDIRAQSTGIDLGDDWYGPGGVGDYAASHGNTPEVLRVAHEIRDGRFDADLARAVDTGESYDLVVVGGGFAGLAAAHHFRRLEGGGRCLILENHPIFGGEARRNEFDVDGQRVVAHQGSAIFLVPQKGGYTDRFYDLIGMDRSAFEYQRWRGPSPEMPLNHSPYDEPKNYGFYFGPEFGK
ncbi:MAG TPA: NAD(P)-binding protein, partial [Dongiaceae bacterium]|nr:NAD(P)-binding protein [Dongiaceae bacterium]